LKNVGTFIFWLVSWDLWYISIHQRV
jgi:hypothetical protein